MKERCEVYDPDCYGCQLREKGVTVPPSATPTRQVGSSKRRPIRQPSWEKGRVTEKRRGGFEMPILNSDMKPMTVHEAQSDRRRIREGIRATKQGVTTHG